MWRNLGGHLVVGPTAVDVASRSPPVSVPAAVSNSLQHLAKSRLSQRFGSLLLSYSGLRPATGQSDYVVAAADDWLTVAGIRSTGFTAALALARYSVGLLLGRDKVVGPEDPRWAHVPPGLEQELARHQPHPQTALRIRSKI